MRSGGVRSQRLTKPALPAASPHLPHPTPPPPSALQERSTKISHGGTARLATKYGDEKLAWLCGRIAQDESRHEAAYTRTMDAIYKR